MNPYQKYVSGFARLFADGKSLSLGGMGAPAKTPPPPGAPVIMLFSPHPDDECITGGLALRFMREAQMRVVNVAVTLGNNKERRAARLAELKNACNWIGFELEETGLDKVSPAVRDAEPPAWNAAVKTITTLLLKHQPRAIFLPHEQDWHGTHVGTHFLVMDALKMMPGDFKTTLAETEFWGQMASPNLLVELSANDAADLIAALTHHVGEVKRNAYHLRLPAWLQDNVRRGAELVGGAGAFAPDLNFATLYRVRKWEKGGIQEAFKGGKQITVIDSPKFLLD